jgi:hypothetical protein
MVLKPKEKGGCEVATLPAGVICPPKILFPSSIYVVKNPNGELEGAYAIGYRSDHRINHFYVTSV